MIKLVLELLMPVALGPHLKGSLPALGQERVPAVEACQFGRLGQPPREMLMKLDCQPREEIIDELPDVLACRAAGGVDKIIEEGLDSIEDFFACMSVAKSYICQKGSWCPTY